MLLVVDIGNTNITLGFFEGDDYVKEIRLASDRDLTQDEYENIFNSILKDYQIDGCVIGSVVDELNSVVKNSLDAVLGCESLFVDNKIDSGVVVKIDNPEELGADRIANAVAAVVEYDGAVIVVDFGTATSFDVISKNREFLGGVIAPGVRTQLNSLNIATSKLPKISPQCPNNAIGTNTKDAVLSGVIRGTAHMADGIISDCEKELGQKVFIVATGGNSSLVTKYMSRKIDKIDPIFTLKGFKYIYQRNFKSG